MSRASKALADVPVATLSIMGLCCAVYLYQFFFDPPLHQFTMCPRLVIYLGEYYRVVTSSLFHANLMHIGMNMMSTAAISSSLERQCGTLVHVITVLWGILLTSTVYIIASYVPYALFGYDKMMMQHSVGFSGVIFQLSVLESNLNPDATRSIFGFFRVPAKAYPWALLVALQFIMPQVSFLGHLSGILVGTLQLYGALDFVFPSQAYLRRLEEWNALDMVTSKPGFVKTPAENPTRRGGPAELLGVALAGVLAVWTLVKNVGETIWVCIFGRGMEANENIQLGDVGAAWGSSDSNGARAAAGSPEGNVGEDDSWAGLPPINELSERSGFL